MQRYTRAERLRRCFGIKCATVLELVSESNGSDVRRCSNHVIRMVIVHVRTASPCPRIVRGQR